MNFFEHQAAAKKKTGLLVLLMGAAIISLVLITTLLVGGMMYFFQNHATSVHAANAYQTSFVNHIIQLVQTPTFAYIGIGVSSVVLIGSLFKWLQLGRGGRYVAEALGGRLLNHNTQDLDEKRVLNVVEEMAIASGNPVPLVFLMEESGINAFAAGLSRRDAVIGVTRGCIQALSREELQGVIAHEFSHIHNGDMRLNLKLIAFIHGIIIIGLIGELLLRSGAYSRGGKNDSRGAQLSAGLALIAIGYGGTFFGNIIKAAVSRQREFLADASAVQFTRNPAGISGALKKIGGHQYGAMLSSGGASEFSHLYFGQGIPLAFNALMATHPPLEQRIRRVEPRWDGKFTPVDLAQSHSQTQAPNTSNFAGDTGVDINEIIETIGEVDQESLDVSQQSIHTLPAIIEEAVHNPYSARALIYCLLLDTDKTIRAGQIESLKDNAHPNTLLEMQRLYQPMQGIERSQYLIITDLCMPALKLLSTEQRITFKRNLVSLIREDSEVSLFEWCLYRITLHNIEQPRQGGGKRIAQCQQSIQVVLSATVQVSQDADREGAFKKAQALLNLPRLEQLGGYTYKALDTALNELAALKPLEKPLLLKALMAIIKHDEQVNAEEAELFRAIADTLDCPVPPFYPTH